MRKVNLIQGSPEWDNHRYSFFNASEAPAMMGDDPNTPRNELLRLKKTGDKKEFSDFVQKNVLDKGHVLEAKARPILEAKINDVLYPETCVEQVEGMMLSASLDGMTMMENVIFEHKQWNTETAAVINSTGKLPNKFMWQVEHQLLVTGADVCIFVMSDGTEENWVELRYESNPVYREQLIAGWKQFKEDMLNYVPQEVIPAPTAKTIRDLPYLDIRVSGAVTHSNLGQYREAAAHYIQSINTDLQNDQDFADAEADIKFCQNAEKSLKQAKEDALSQTAEIDDLMKTIDFIAEEMRKKRLSLEKLVQSEKQNRKLAIAEGARKAYLSHLVGLEDELEGIKLITAPEISWNEVLKGKRTIESLQNAADTALAQAKIAANDEAKRYRDNIAMLREAGDQYQHLFTDLQNLVTKPADDFALVVKTRCQDEDKRIEAIKEAEIEAAKRAEEEARKQEEEQETAPAPETAQVPPKASTDPEPVATAPETTQAPENDYKADILPDKAFSAQLAEWQKANRITKKATRQLVDMIEERFTIKLEIS